MIIDHLVSWIIADLKIEKQIDIEDVELMRLGFSWTETQSLSLHRRSELLEASSIVADWKAILDRKKQMEIATLSSGFASADVQRKIQAEWRSEISENLQRLRVYTLDSADGIISIPETNKNRKFSDVLRGLKSGKIDNNGGTTIQDDEDRPEPLAHGGTDTDNPIL